MRRRSCLPTITSHTHPFTVCLFHITCRMAVSDTDMGKQRHAAGVLTGRDEGICMPRCSSEWGRAIERRGIGFWMRGS